LLHGNPYRTRRIVLSQELLDAKEYTNITLVKSASMIETFVRTVKHASQFAKKINAPLLLLVFCHGLEKHDLLLDDGNRNKGLSATYLKGFIELGCRVTLVTTACHSGGWVINPDFNHTVLAAAKEKSESNSWLSSASVGRFCGSIFASTLINTLTSVSSPLLEEPVQGPAEMKQTLGTVQPDQPSERQTETYNQFCRSIVETCKTRIHRLWDKQYFTFSAQDDLWGDSWTGRKGIPLINFEARWNRLPAIHFELQPGQPYLLTDPDPRNCEFDSTVPTDSLTGGLQDEYFDKDCGSLRQRAEAMARLLLQTCPHNWTRGWEAGLSGRLSAFAEGEIIEDFTALHVMSVVQFRWDMAGLADKMVSDLGLPKPGNNTCVWWDPYAWEHEISKHLPNYDDLHTTIWRLFRDEDFDIEPTTEQGPRFYRWKEYLIAVIVEARMSKEESITTAYRMIEYVNNMKQLTNDRVCREARVRTLGRNWLVSLGRRIRDSVSPTRRSHQRGKSLDQKPPSAAESRARFGSTDSAMSIMSG
jgi:hypothetical protein